MENFFGLMKQEMYYGVICSHEELKAAIERYIKYYNEQRIKEKLGWKVLYNTEFSDRQHKKSNETVKTVSLPRSNFLGSHHALRQPLFEL